MTTRRLVGDLFEYRDLGAVEVNYSLLHVRLEGDLVASELR